MADEMDINPNDIAIVGMALRVPGANDPDAYWRNLREGVESIRTFTDEELIAHGEAPETLRRKNYVRAAAPLDAMEMFDGDLFGFSPKESAILDPQHRHFYELCWEAFERAGHPPESFAGPVGVWAGCGMGSYFYFNLCRNPELVRSVGMFLLRHTGNDKDFLATRASYLFDLKGPAINVQTACSTSLVAVHLACQSLLSREVDMALAGGVTIELPHRRGYLFHEGEILSPDGHCHAFDHRAQGTVFGSGGGVVVLRRLEDALADGDVIHAVIRGSAVNNDGSGKVNYLAPSVDGQARCMAEAHAIADVSPDTIDYVEAHGTGTYLGDPIEIAALTQAFRQGTKRTGFCRIGSVKTNIGHLDTAAGVASLVKAALALREKQMPPSLGYEKPNPTIDFETSPFVVNDRLRDWPRGSAPRRAAVNSLGVGGTNAHVILEEPPSRPASSPSSRRWQLLTLSGKSLGALQGNTVRLAEHLRAHPAQSLADVSFTLHHGRRALDRRRIVACESHEEGARLLLDNDPQRVFTHTAVERAAVAFLLPGGGAQYVGMGRDLYEREPVFRASVDRGLSILATRHGVDLRPVLFATDAATATAQLERMPLQLPAIFLVEHALAELWASWGVKPTALLGHSLGENTAACLAGVMSYEDALGLVALRGKLFAKVPGGAMLSVNLDEAATEQLLARHPELDVAVLNVPDVTVVSGPSTAIDALARELAEREIEHRRLAIPVAAHSRALAPILEEFGAYLRSIRLSAPKIRMLSNRTGTWLTDAEATSPDYWVGHLRGAVRFSQNLATLLADPKRVVIECGPGRTLASLAKQHPSGGASLAAIGSMRHRDETVPDDAHFVTALGRAWAAGITIDWAKMFEGETRRRVELPTYAFQHQRYFIEPAREASAAGTEIVDLLKKPDLRDWGYRPTWTPRAAPRRPRRDPDSKERDSWLVFVDGAGLGARLVARLEARGDVVVTVHEGDTYAQVGERAYTLAPERGKEGYGALVRDLVARGLAPRHVAHLWLTTADESFRPGSSFFHRNQERGFYSLLFLAQAIAEESMPVPASLTAITNGTLAIEGLERAPEALPHPEKATAIGPVRVIPRELAPCRARLIDVVLPASARPTGLGALLDPFASKRDVSGALDALASRLEGELVGTRHGEDAIVALRDDGRFSLDHEPVVLEPSAQPLAEIGEGAVVLVTGGLGGLGLLFARHLAETRRAKLVLVSRSELPAREAWDAHVALHGDADRASQRIAAVRAIEATGAEVLVVSADVTIEMEMEEVVRATKARFGRVDVVLHTAGVVRDALLVAKSQAECEEVFTPKIHGTLVLERVLAGEPLSHFILFSSSSAIIGARGQVDYTAANAFLDAFAVSRDQLARSASRRTRHLALAWGVWSDVGMAHEAMTERTSPVTWRAFGPASHPLFEVRERHPRGDLAVRGTLHPSTQWILDEHRTGAGHALVPGTGFLELMRAALVEIGERGPFELGDVFFIRPLAVGDDESRALRVSLRPNDAGYAIEVRSRVEHEGAPAWELHAQAQASLVPLPPPAAIPVATIEARCDVRRRASATGLVSPQEAHLRFGPRWRVLREVAWGRGEAIAELSLDARFEQETESFALHPALLDLATGYAMDLIEGYDASRLWVPVGYESVRVHRKLPARIRSWARIHGGASQSGDFASFDLVLADVDGTVAVEVTRFTIKKLDGGLDLTQRAAQPAPGELIREDAGPRELSPAEEQLQRNLEQGILASEGLDLLARALATDAGPRVLVSSLDLDGLLAQAARATDAPRDEGDTARFARPDLASVYVAPRDDLERTIVGFFQDLLGVEMVGVDDSFFDLGGHSLIAVRLFAAIKKAYRAEFPISILFEAPTAARIAERVREKVGASAGPTSTPSTRMEPTAAPRTRYKHLVAMHPGADSGADRKGGARPFFLVAGMFGNVLNLRHLAHLIGEGRPFYGLQARGLYGDETPHERFEEMARAYLDEIRTVQPEGPYLLGGFSGGGVTAYEMARQIVAAGERVGMLVMLDTPVPQRPPLSARDRARIQLDEIQRRGPRYLSEWVEKRAEWEMLKLRRRFEPPAEGDRSTAEFHNEKMESAFRAALGRYTLARYEGDVVLYRPRLTPRWSFADGTMIDKDRHYMSADNGWTPWVRGLDVIEVPGDHDAMVLEPNVRVLAKRMRKAIEAAERTLDDATRRTVTTTPSPAARALAADSDPA